MKNSKCINDLATMVKVGQSELARGLNPYGFRVSKARLLSSRIVEAGQEIELPVVSSKLGYCVLYFVPIILGEHYPCYSFGDPEFLRTCVVTSIHKEDWSLVSLKDGAYFLFVYDIKECKSKKH